ncbi:MAG: hypothetical protein B6I35_14235 [Anaerolineaceae bacterium 4572_32.2]|nr:MAG: hypothetical protein B6I35_14235 [Anaerolineaceae bacterium 4572_32.2]
MGMSDHWSRLRKGMGHDLLLVPSAVACIRDSDRRILLLRRSDGDDLWGFPGGVEPVQLIGVYSTPEYAFAYPNGDQVQPVTIFFDCRVVGGEIRPDLEEILAARYFGHDDELPPLRPCCVAKARDAFAFDGQAYFR